MIFEKFNPKIHNSYKIAELMYSVDFRTYLEIFKTKDNAITAIEDLILIDEKIENLDKLNYIIYVVLENSDFKNLNPDIPENIPKNIPEKDFDTENDFDNNVIGIIEIVNGKKDSLFRIILYFLMNLKLDTALKLSYIYFLDSLVLSQFNEDDLYIAEIAVDPAKQGQGFGKKIIKKTIEKARKKGFKRVILDVDLRNIEAIKLYESIGFRKFQEKTAKPFKQDRGMYNMEYIL